MSFLGGQVWQQEVSIRSVDRFYYGMVLKNQLQRQLGRVFSRWELHSAELVDHRWVWRGEDC